MKIKHVLVALLVVVALVSCNTKNAVEFNDKLVGMQKSLMTEVNKMQGDTTNPEKKLSTIQQLAKDKITEIKKLEAPKDGEGFKQAMIDDFDGIVSSYDILLKMLKEKGNDEKLQQLQNELVTISSKVEKLDANVIVEQKKFASKYNIRLENK
ncbi:MAG: hypothetical protein KA319_11720 [Ferruginibacter sp.]|nr:hypothetical protein [Ferruginibacter sp.]